MKEYSLIKFDGSLLLSWRFKLSSQLFDALGFIRSVINIIIVSSRSVSKMFIFKDGCAVRDFYLLSLAVWRATTLVPTWRHGSPLLWCLWLTLFPSCEGTKLIFARTTVLWCKEHVWKLVLALLIILFWLLVEFCEWNFHKPIFLKRFAQFALIFSLWLSERLIYHVKLELAQVRLRFILLVEILEALLPEWLSFLMLFSPVEAWNVLLGLDLDHLLYFLNLLHNVLLILIKPILVQ